MKQKELSIILRVALGFCTAFVLLFLYLQAKELYCCLFDGKEGLAASIVNVFAYVPVFWAIYDAWIIFRDIGLDKSFTEKNAQRLRRISLCALAEIAIIIIFMVLFALGQPEFGGTLILCVILIFAALAIAAAAAVLSHLTAKAARMQDENDLTI